MKIFILKMRYIIAFFMALIMIPAVYFSLTKSISAVNTNERKIPIYSVERDDNKIALTFDCAWSDDDIDSILDTLNNYNVKASFFITGDWAQKYPDSVKKISQNGHDIGNHSYNHADYTKLSEDDILNDLDKCDDAIRKITGEKPFLMRAPSGGYNNTVMDCAEKSGRVYVQWSIDSLDYTKDATEESIKKRLSKTKDGDIILMHSGTKLTAPLLPSIIEDLMSEHELVKASDLIYSDNYYIDHAGRQIKK